MKRLLLALMVFLAVLTPSASAGTYDVVSCHAPGADMRNLAWAFETFNATGKPAPSPERFVLNPLSPDGCASAVGVTFSSEPARRTVIVDDGGAWVFRAPAGTTVKRMQIWRNAATTKSVDDAGTGGVENGWWTLYARAGDQVARAGRARRRDLPGQRADPAGRRVVPQGRRELPRHRAGHLRRRRARRELGHAVHRAGDHVAVLHRQRHRRPRASAPAGRCRDRRRPRGPRGRPRPARRRCAAHERDLHRRRNATRRASARCAC